MCIWCRIFLVLSVLTFLHLVVHPEVGKALRLPSRRLLTGRSWSKTPRSLRAFCSHASRHPCLWLEWQWIACLWMFLHMKWWAMILSRTITVITFWRRLISPHQQWTRPTLRLITINRWILLPAIVTCRLFWPFSDGQM